MLPALVISADAQIFDIQHASPRSGTTPGEAIFMAAIDQQFSIVIIFFIYGLAFFSMGLVMSLEAGRFPSLVDARILLPLAFFGIIHGNHEWLEMGLLVAKWFIIPIPDEIDYLRLGMLIVSFSLLVVYAIQVLNPQGQKIERKYIYIGVGLLALYVCLVVFIGLAQKSIPSHWMEDADALSRYLLAVPGAALAALALWRQAQRAESRQWNSMARSYKLAAIGFGLYAITQIFVGPVDLFPANYLNTVSFYQTVGIPIQAFRAALAVLITFGLLRASQLIERERRNEMVAAQRAQVATMEQRARDLMERETMRRELLRYIVVAQEDERTRIARELHDETAQFLTALSLDLASLRNTISESLQATKLIDRLQDLNRQMSQGIYRMVHDLRPAQLDDLGLVAGIKYLIDEERSRTGLVVTLSSEGDIKELDPLVETVIFRVAQEALTNVARHAQCDQAQLRLSYEPNEVRLIVHDDGVGIDSRPVTTNERGWGIAGMRERVEAVGGQMFIDSTPGQGTTVMAIVPLVNEEVREEHGHGNNSIIAG